MKILLIMTDARIHRLDLGSFRMSFREAPLTLTTLAALVPEELNATVRIIDESVEPIPDTGEYDLVGISCLTGTSLRAYEIADRFRAQGSTVVLGGVHVSLLPDEAKEHADAIVIGFAEQTWPQLLRDFAAGKLQPRYHEAEVDLRGLPQPRRDLQKKRGYMMPQTVFASRGCKGGCDFCTVPAVPFGWHTRPVQDVIDEVRKLPGKRFAFNDVSLIEDRDYALELFTALTGVGKLWGGLTTTQIGKDDELLELMARSGCIYLLIGLESVHNAGLKAMGKAFNKIEEYRQLVNKLHAQNITLQGCFIFGLDSDTPAVFDETVELVNDLKVDIPRYALYTPYPGTRAFHRLEREDRILHRNWYYYDTQHVVIQPTQMTPEELDAGFIRAYEKTFKTGSILKRTLGSPRFPVTFIGNLAYKRYVKRLQTETNRLFSPSAEGVA